MPCEDRQPAGADVVPASGSHAERASGRAAHPRLSLPDRHPGAGPILNFLDFLRLVGASRPRTSPLWPSVCDGQILIDLAANIFSA